MAVIIGTEFDETITGTEEDDVITGGVNTDEILGLGGSDLIGANAGGVLVDGGADDDFIEGGQGADTLLGGTGNDTLSVRFDGFANILDGGAGYDRVEIDRSSSFAATVSGASLVATIGASSWALSDIEEIETGRGNDTLDFSAFAGWALVAIGGDGDDLITGTALNDTLTGWRGNDTIDGGAGDDSITGDDPSGAAEEGRDVLSGGAGNDIIDAGAWDDTVDGGTGSDTMAGGTQDFYDILDYSGAGNALTLDLVGGQSTVGADVDSFTEFEGVYGTAYGDVIDGTGAPARFPGLGLWFEGRGGADSLTGGDGDDHLDGGFSADTLVGGAGNDTLTGGYGDDSIDGGTGTDMAYYDGFGGGITVSLLLSGPQYTGGAGTDTLVDIEALTGGDYNDRFIGSTGDNLLVMGAGSDTVIGLGGRDTIMGQAGNDNLIGGAGEDTLTGNEGRDVLLGGADSDYLLGGDDNDQLRGGSGTDVLIGGDGRDILIGGDYVSGGYPGDGAADVFDFDDVMESQPGASTRDTIRDFEVGLDLIDLSTMDADNGATASDDAFTFIGTAAFSGTAGELRYFTTAASTLVRADVDGDGTADFEILMNGAMTLAATDFVL